MAGGEIQALARMQMQIDGTYALYCFIANFLALNT